MIAFESVLLLHSYAVFIEWEEHIHIYALILFIIGVIYLMVYPLIRWAMTLQLTRTVSYVLTILVLTIGMYIYTTMSSDLVMTVAFQKLFESIVLFGGCLLVYMSIRAFIKNKKHKKA